AMRGNQQRAQRRLNQRAILEANVKGFHSALAGRQNHSHPGEAEFLAVILPGSRVVSASADNALERQNRCPAPGAGPLDHGERLLCVCEAHILFSIWTADLERLPRPRIKPSITGNFFCPPLAGSAYLVVIGPIV